MKRMVREYSLSKIGKKTNHIWNCQEGYADWMIPSLSQLINWMVWDYKFVKNSRYPRVTLPKVTSFKEIVSLDLKDVDKLGQINLWQESRSHHQSHKKTWIYDFRIPTVGIRVGNGGVILNQKMGELGSVPSLVLPAFDGKKVWRNRIMYLQTLSNIILK